MMGLPEVIVYGAGPSGLMAAWAAERSGFRLKAIYDRKPARPNGRSAGVFFLHEACDIPDVPSQEILVHSVGSPHDYAEKIYGRRSVKTSFPILSRRQHVFDGMAALDFLWRRYNFPTSSGPALIREGELSSLAELTAIARSNPYLILLSTVPLDKLLGVDLSHAKVWIVDGHMRAGATVQVTESQHLLYNGELDTPWYRASSVFDRWAFEFPMAEQRAASGFARSHGAKPREVTKVQVDQLATTLAGHMPPNLLLTGRYGAWDKSLLTHSVYSHVQAWLGSFSAE